MDIRELREKAMQYNSILEKKKQSLAPKSFWYPYGTLNNFVHLDNLLKGSNRDLLSLINNKPIVDIGAADGDLSFFMETLGVKSDIVDYAPTNHNKLKGANLLKTGLSSKVGIYDVDLDAQFQLPNKDYGLTFFLGILYHLKNPFYALEALAHSTNYCLISTRITKFSPNRQTNLTGISVAYLLEEREANNDPSNYWIFTEFCLRRILKRTGWEICNFMTAGNTGNSDPCSTEGDERAFCLVKSLIAKS